MPIDEKELRKDESFIVQALDEHKTIKALRQALDDYFNNKYGKEGEIQITFDEEIHDWIVSTKNGKKRVGYVESIPKAVFDMLKS